MIFLLHGADSFRRRQKLNELKERFMAAVDPLGQSLIIIEGSQADEKSIAEKIGGASLFAKKRMVIIEGAFNAKNEGFFTALSASCEKNAGTEDNAIILNEDAISPSKLKATAKKLYSWLIKQPYVQEFKPLNNAQIFDFAKKNLNAKGAQITPSALSILVARTGNDLWRLDRESSKLAAASQGKAISQDLVEILVGSEIEENIFPLTDALGSRNSRLAIKLLAEQIAAGLSPEYILAMFERQIKLIMETKALRSEGQINEAKLADQLKIHPFVAKKTLAQSAKFSISELDTIWRSLIDLDLRNKQGRAEIESELFILVAELSK